MKYSEHFLPVEPIGIGTPHVESIPSLVKRWADRNGTSIAEILDYTSTKLNIDFPRFTTGQLMLNQGHGDTLLRKVIDCLSFFQDIPKERLELLTVNRFSNIFARGFLKKERFWNPRFYRDTPHSDWYERLLWSLSPVYYDVCGAPLSYVCANPDCKQSGKPFRWGMEIGSCSNCGAELTSYQQGSGVILEKEHAVMIDWNHSEVAKWIACAAGDLLSIGHEARGFDFNEAFNRWYKLAGFVNLSRAEEKLGLNHVSISKLLEGSRKPTMMQFLGLLYSFGLSSHEFFQQKVVSFQPGESCWFLHQNPHKPPQVIGTRRRKIDQQPIIEKMKSDIKSGIYQQHSFDSYCRNVIGHPLGSLSHFIGDLPKKFQEKSKLYKVDRKRIERARVIGEIEEIYRICKERGITFNGIKVKMMISNPGVAAKPWCAKIIRAIKSGHRQVLSGGTFLEAA